VRWGLVLTNRGHITNQTHPRLCPCRGSGVGGRTLLGSGKTTTTPHPLWGSPEGWGWVFFLCGWSLPGIHTTPFLVGSRFWGSGGGGGLVGAGVGWLVCGLRIV
jgi:hypothetical protein